MKGSSENTPPAAPATAPPVPTSVAAEGPCPPATHAGESREAHGAQVAQDASSSRKRVREDEARQEDPKRARRPLVTAPQEPVSAVRRTLQGGPLAQGGRTPTAQAVPPPGIPQQPQPAASSQALAPDVPARACGRVYMPRLVSVPQQRPHPVWACEPPPPPEFPIRRAQLLAYAAHTGPRCPVPGCRAPAGPAHLETHLPPEMKICGLCNLGYPTEVEVIMHINSVHPWTILASDYVFTE